MNEHSGENYPRFNDPLPGQEPQEFLEKPPVVSWYRAYCVFLVVLYMALVTLGALMVLYRSQIDQLPKSGNSNDMDSTMLLIQGIAIIVVCGLFMAMNLAALFFPNRSWAWIYHLINIALGFGGCMIVFAVPLLVFWLKPETQAYFGRIAPPPASGPPAPIPSA